MQQILDFLGRAEVLVVGLGTAAFLTLFWVVRGAPIGQGTAEEPREAPSSGYRDRAVTLAIVGFLTVIGGAFVAGRFGVPWSIPAFAAGFGLILRVIRSVRPYRHVSPTLRRVLEFSNTAMTASLLGGILLVANVVAFRYGGRPVDFTHDESFTLSSRSVNTFKGLVLSARFTLVLGRSPQSGRHRDRVRQLIALYKAVNPSKVEVEELVSFNPDQATGYEAAVKRAPDLGVIPGDAVLVEYGEGDSAARSVLAVADMFREPNARGDESGRFAVSFAGEDAITSTVVRLSEGRRSTIGFTGGHGEPSLGEMDPRQPGLGLLRTRISSAGADAVELNLIRDEVPAGLSLLVVVAPRARFQDQEVAKIRSFIAKGGPLLFLIDGAGAEKAGLDELLALYNIGFDPGLIVDPTLNVFGRPNLVVTPPIARGEHPITEPLGDMSFLLPNAAPIRIIGSTPPRKEKPGPSVNPGMVDAPFLRTGQTAWSEANPAGGRPEFTKGTDLPGPHVVGVAVTERPEVSAEGTLRPRMVILSSPLMATNSYIYELFPSNADLVMDAIQWLRGRPDSLGVSPKVHTAMVFSADPNLRARLHAVPTILAFFLIVGLGLTTWLARRS